jgi:hypothetical protein
MLHTRRSECHSRRSFLSKLGGVATVGFAASAAGFTPLLTKASVEEGHGEARERVGESFEVRVRAATRETPIAKISQVLQSKRSTENP